MFRGMERGRQRDKGRAGCGVDFCERYDSVECAGVEGVGEGVETSV